ncbi:MAG: ATP-binding protein [Candidatus Bathyarchaeota archaeon]|nr:ATP-binding protein [Candidatus Bathyarchaeota archaeon]
MGEDIGVLNTLKEIGIIVGEASSSEFYFSSKPEEMPSRWEYVVVFSLEDIGGVLKEVPVIAQVQGIVSMSQALTRDLDFDITKKLVEAGIADRKVWCKARILGYLGENGEVLQPRKAVMPGKPVYMAPRDLLEKFYSFPDDEAVHIGHLITRSEIPISLSLRGFRRHLAIIAQTGAGKSYLAGVLAEELLRKGATIIMLDPHADYVFLSKTVEGVKHELSDNIIVFRNPASTGRYSDADVGRVNPYEVCFSDLDLDEICLIARISERYVNIRNSLEKAVTNVRRRKSFFSPRDVLEELQQADSWAADEKERAAARAAQKYVKRIIDMKVFTNVSTSIDKMLKPMQLSVIDLSGLEDEVSDYIAYRILSEVYEKMAGGEFKYPVFIFIEEAHRFIPPEGRTYSSTIIKKISAEGRKFGVFLILITQRPSKIHSDALSQCNSQIIMRITNPEDQKAVSASSERMSHDLLEDLPGLNVGEAIVVGEITKAPVMVKVKKRRTREGGADIDIVGKLKEALSMAGKDGSRLETERLRDELKEFYG